MLLEEWPTPFIIQVIPGYFNLERRFWVSTFRIIVRPITETVQH